MGFFRKAFGTKSSKTDNAAVTPGGGDFASALLMHLRDEVDAALGSYFRILEERPEDNLAPFFAAAIIAAKGDTAEAAETLRSLSRRSAVAGCTISQAISSDLSNRLINEPLIKFPAVAAIIVSLGDLLKKERFVQESAVCYEIAAGIVPDHADILYKLGDTLHDLGMYDYAESVLERALKFAPNHWGALYTFAVLLQDLGRNEEALPYYEKAVKFNPDHAGCHNNYGAALFRMNRLEEALFHCTTAQTLDPSAPLVKINLGNIYFLMQDFETARACFGEAIALNGNLAVAYFGLAAVEKALGSDPEVIRSLYLKAIEINPEFTEARQALEELQALDGKEAQ